MIRGDVHAINLPRGRGDAQHGPRFAVVVQANDLSLLSTVVVCPTSTSTRATSFHPEVAITGKPSRVMCEMVGVVDARALGAWVGHLTLDELKRVDDGLTLVLDLR